MDGSVESIFGSGVGEDFYTLNARLKFEDTNGNIDFDADRRAVRKYFLDHVNQNTVFFHTLEEKLNYLVGEGYYEAEILEPYPFEFLEELWAAAFAAKFRFPTLMGAYKYYRTYALKTRDGKRYLERYEDRVCMVALGLARGDQVLAMSLMKEMISGATSRRRRLSSIWARPAAVSWYPASCCAPRTTWKASPATSTMRSSSPSVAVVLPST